MKRINNIFVIGGAGFIGANLIQRLKGTLSNKIICLDNYYTGDHNKHIPDVTYKVCSTFDENDLRACFEQWEPTLVFHFGEYARVIPSFNDRRYVFKSNLSGTANVINLCLEYNSMLIYSASSSKFGGNENLSPYSWAKAKMVELIKNYGEWGDLNYQICYFYNVYGKGECALGDYATVIAKFKHQYKNNLPLTVVGDGKQTRQFTHVYDIIDALFKIMVYKEKNQEWHLTSGKTYSILEVARMFSDNIKFIPKNKGERQNVTDVTNKTNNKLDWKPKRTLIDYILGTKST